MNQVQQDALARLREMHTCPKQITSKNLDIIMSYQQGETITNIIRKTGLGETAVRNTLKRLGLLVRRNREHGTKVIPWSSPLRCQRCGILLQYADWQRDGLCDWCIEMEQRVPDENAEIDYVLEQEVKRG